MTKKNNPKYPGVKITTNGNQFIGYHTEARLADAGIFYPITPSTEMGENFELSFAKGELNVFGNAKIAIETEGEHAAQGGAIACSLTGKRVVNFTASQGLVYGLEQYYHAPGKLSSMVVEVASRALTRHALNVHCGHDDIYAMFGTGWNITFAKDAQQAADQALILRKVNELSLTPGINGQDGFLTSHLERSFLKHEAGLIREYLGRPDDMIDCPTKAQIELFGPKRRRIPESYSLKEPMLLGTVQNQEHYMNGVAARRNNFYEQILGFFEKAYAEFGELTGRNYGLISEYNTKDAETVFVCIGSAAENIEAAVDYIKKRDGINIGVIHINVLRPFPEEVVINALKGKKNVIVLERADEPISGDNPLTRDLRTALSKALENSRGKAHSHLPAIKINEMPNIFSGVYGLGSRDFRPEDIFGAYEYVVKGKKRQDGKSAKDGEHFFYLSINHPYAVSSEDKPSLLPEKAIAVRFHSIGGWGAITTGKNLSEILGDLGTYIKERDFPGTDKEVVHISANPKYGSEKKGAPTNYFLVAAPERIRVNCDLQHVDVVLCCDPKAFTHTNPLIGLKEGGALVWENSENTPEIAWKRIPVAARKEIIEKKIKVYLLNGFMIAREATARTDLQLRMQGNSFLGAFFKVAAFLKENKIPDLEFLNIVEQQYKKKFGKLGAAVVESNMTVMREGFEQVKEMPYGDVEDGDLSLMQGEKILPLTKDDVKAVSAQCPMLSREKFNSEFRAGLGYFQPASPLASTGIITVGTGEQSSKFVSRRLVPKYSPQKCTQCMECVIACPDTALPCTVQEIKEVLKTAIENYVVNKDDRATLLTIAVKAEKDIRAEMLVEAKNKERAKLFVDIAIKYISTNAKNLKSAKSIIELENILKKLPFAYAQTPLIFAMKEKQNPGSGGLFSIFVQDLCKGCGHCVKQCKFDALEMVVETEELTADMHTAKAFMHKLPETLPQYMGLYNSEKPMDTRAAALKYLLMQRKNYQAMVCGDGACAGCGEKTVLRNLASITEAYMRPLFHAKADRLRVKADLISKKGLQALEKLEKTDPETYKIFKRTVLHTLMHYGGESLEDTKAIMQQFKGSNEEIIKTVIDILNQDAFNHKDLQAIEGKVGNGMCVMGMTASTGCNSVYSSTPPANPHTYPWVNSLFQDGSTIGWLMAESFIVDHARKSVMPERFADLILDSFNQKLTEEDYFNYTHFTDKFLTEQEIKELPKIWAIGGDGALGDIGFQNLSKTMLQNRPNYHCLMLDTQVYSNTGGQNSDSSVMPGGFDMNQYGAASQGKLTEKKEVAQIFTVGHGSPYVAQVSMANSATFFRAVMESLDYRGAAFIQAYTPCMPEHAIGDDTASKQSKLAKDSRGMVEFIYNSQKGETDAECLDVNGNANVDRDWVQKVNKISKEKYNFTVFHWAVTEGRFRNHVKKAPVNYKEDGVYLDDILNKVTQQDVISRNVFQKEHPAYIPDFHVYADVEQADGSMKPYVMSRQMVLFCIERRKNWRKLQARAGVVNQDYTV